MVVIEDDVVNAVKVDVKAPTVAMVASCKGRIQWRVRWPAVPRLLLLTR